MKLTDFIEIYAQEVLSQKQTGQAKEHAYRPALERLMSSFDDVKAVNDPKRSDHGNPDMVFLKKSDTHMIIGYAEAKDVDVLLDKTEKTNQMQRYSGYDNLFLTNYLEFRFYVNGDKKATIDIGKLVGDTVVLLPENYAMLADELQNFLTAAPESIRSGKRLALIMGAKARRIRDRVNRKFSDEQMQSNELTKIYTVMKELLVHDLTTTKFADMYAQTLVYGLFVARYGDTTQETFTREEARDLVPITNPFLRDFFDHIAGSRFDKDLAQIVDELCEVFRVSDVNTLVRKHLRLFELDDDNEKDPIIHFYEDFLKEYDPKLRQQMGAYYTPIPVVKFMIRQVDELLKTEFGLQKGLADTSKIDHVITDTGGKKYKNQIHRVQVLDPAVGTATFLNEIIKHIHSDFAGQEGRWPAYAQQELVPRLHGFELMMAPYTIAHLKLGMTLQESGVQNINTRLGVYLTNTLEEGESKQVDLFTAFGLAGTISHEANEAAKIKHDRPIMVVIGNPPYSGVSSNETLYANGLIKKYKVEPGGKQKLQERKHWLNDDYVKFIAFAEDLIEKNGEGVMAMITNNGYLDNPTFRGMRWHLAKTFDKIYVLDLHGNAKKKEVAPGGGKDENVFDIMQGVGIILAVKNSTNRGELAEVYHAHLYGKRRAKFEKLLQNVEFEQLAYDAKNVYFVPKDTRGQTEYDSGVAIEKLFALNSVGFVTANDKLNISMSLNESVDKIDDLIQLSEYDWRIKYDRNKDSRDWQYRYALEDAKTNRVSKTPLRISYRPFDYRYSLYTANSRGLYASPQPRVMLHMQNENNLALAICRQHKTGDFHHVLMADRLIESSYVSNKTSEITSAFPLYLYHEDGTRTANFNAAELKKLTVNLTREYAPEDILDYIYAVLHSPKYRETYKEFLKMDFPRVPAPASQAEFNRLVGLGRELRELHLMKSPLLDAYETTYPAAGTDEVELLKYADENVHINDSQYFGNVPEVAWSFFIGGYQPAQKWLKDRKGRTLSSEDIDHYQKIVKILVETERLMDEIDKVESST